MSVLATTLNVLSRGNYYRSKYIGSRAAQYAAANDLIDSPPDLGEPARWHALFDWIIWIVGMIVQDEIFPGRNDSMYRVNRLRSNPDLFGPEGCAPGFRAMSAHVVRRLEPDWAEPSVMDDAALYEMEAEALSQSMREGSWPTVDREFWARVLKGAHQTRRADERRGLLRSSLSEFVGLTGSREDSLLRQEAQRQAAQIFRWTPDDQAEYEQTQGHGLFCYLRLYRRLIGGCLPSMAAVDPAQAVVFAQHVVEMKEIYGDMLADLGPMVMDFRPVLGRRVPRP